MFGNLLLKPIGDGSLSIICVGASARSPGRHRATVRRSSLLSVGAAARSPGRHRATLVDYGLIGNFEVFSYQDWATLPRNVHVCMTYKEIKTYMKFNKEIK
jgi:hypothetical protein